MADPVPRSQSGLFRQSIGPRKKHLKNLLAQADPIKKTSTPPDPDAAQVLLEDVEDLAIRLESTMEGLINTSNNWLELIDSLPDEEKEAEETLYATTAFEESDGFIIVVDHAKVMIRLLKRQAERIAKVASPTTPTHSPGRASTARLPKLNMPRFGGDVMQWDKFWALYNTNIHSAKDLTSSEKFAWLQTLVYGPAELAIEGMPVNDANYEEAVKILQKRFSKTDHQLVPMLYSQLRKLPPSSMKSADLHRTYDTLNVIFRRLESAGEVLDTNRQLVLDVFSKFPEAILRELAKHYKISNESTVTEVCHALSKYITENEELSNLLKDLNVFESGFNSSKSASTSNKPERANFEKSYPSSYQQSPHSSINSGASAYPKSPSSAMYTNEKHESKGSQPQRYNDAPSRPISPCYFCGGKHYNAHCEKFRTAEARVKQLDVRKRCRRCTNHNHTYENCRTAAYNLRCHHCKTSGSHTSVLCPVKYPTTTTTAAAAIATTESVKTTSNLCHGEDALLSTAVATIRNPESGIESQARIILDSGSQRSYVTERFAQKLKSSPAHYRNMKIAIFATERSISLKTGELTLEIALRNGGSKTITVNTTPMVTGSSLCSDRLPAEAQRVIQSMSYALADDFTTHQGPPDLLIGSDYFWQFITGGKIVPDGCNSLYLIPSILGLILTGSYDEVDGVNKDEEPVLFCLTERPSAPCIESGLAAITTTNCTKPSQPDIDQFWQIESMGIRDNPVDDDDALAQQQFDTTVKFQDGRYFVCWPWNENKQLLQSNYWLALRRLKSMVRRLHTADPLIRAEWKKVIMNQLELNVVEFVPEAEIKTSKHAVHYLAHHPVVRSNHETTKVRIVYDASAKCGRDSVSLNECMRRGPVLLPDLCAILLRFRLQPVVVTGDIEKAFLQLGLQESERDATRFLWFEDPDDPDNSAIWHLRFARVPFGIICSPYMLAATLIHHLKTVNTPTALQIQRDTYVDNVITGTTDTESAVQFYTDAKQMFQAASMNLREWCSNSEAVMDSIPANDRVSNRTMKILGLQWNSVEDTLQLRGHWPSRAVCRTKRDVLQAIASVFDPLGLFQPCTLRTKVFLRELWNAKLGWDDVLSEALQQQWTVLHADIGPLFEVKLPRMVNCGLLEEASLVAFSDASMDAYATAIYLRTRSNSTGQWQVSLQFSKSKLAPKTETNPAVSLPRLELLGLSITVKAVDFVRSSLCHTQPLHCYVMSDSTCVLEWLRSDKPLPVFVKNRVKLIRKLENAEFHHVSTAENPADIPTRGVSGTEIANRALWWHGPAFLQQDSELWPTRSVLDVVTDVQLRQIEEKSGPAVYHLLAGEGPPDENQLFGIDPTTHSSLRKLLRVSSWCMKFLKKMLWSRLPVETQQLHTGLSSLFEATSSEPHVTASELKTVKLMWIKATQAIYCDDVITAIRNKKCHQLITQLNLELDAAGFVRSCGRFRHADLPDDAISPLLLPKSAHLTNLVVAEVHESLFHSGVNHTLSQIRRQFWIPHGRVVVQKIITRCVICRKHHGHPFALPKMPPWPRERVSRSVPFEYTGLDYLGPINVNVNGEVMKMWVCIFTCLAVRAIHLQIVWDCTAESFVNCLKSFINRRGCPTQIISDNAPQFKLAKTLFDRTWHRVLRDESVMSYVSHRGINWKFTVQLAPWQGGFYERMVGIVKNAFKCAVGRRLLTFSQFEAVITEVEAIVNSRPITFVHSDVNSGQALRPVDFLTDLRIGTPSVDPKIPAEGGDAGKQLMKTYKYRQQHLDKLWQIWIDDYLLNLRERGQTGHRNRRSDLPSKPYVGEIVIVKNPDVPRGVWKLGRVSKLIRSNDGAVRSAEVLLPNGYTIRRAMNFLYRLEIPSNSNAVDVPDVDAAANQPEDTDNTAAADVSADFDVFELDDVEESEKAVAQFGPPVPASPAVLALARRELHGGLNAEAVVLSFEATL